VPCLATRVPKTADLEGVFPRAQSLEELRSAVKPLLEIPFSHWKGLYEKFKSQMDPREHLIAVERVSSIK
jgi:hypothetical protein